MEVTRQVIAPFEEAKINTAVGIIAVFSILLTQRAQKHSQDTKQLYFKCSSYTQIHYNNTFLPEEVTFHFKQNGWVIMLVWYH